MRAMNRHLRNFLTDTTAATSFEAVIIFPLFAWAWIGTFSFFDAYRVYNTSIKSTYAIADLISRQTSTVYGYDIEGMAEMLEMMIRDTTGVEMRVTQILRDTHGDYRVDWSHGTGSQARLYTANLSEFEDRLPDMANGERIVLVESFVVYDPAFSYGLTDLDFENFTVTRPRYAGQVPYDDDMTPPTS
jgi:Flp pilus assembly protein TadG